MNPTAIASRAAEVAATDGPEKAYAVAKELCLARVRRDGAWAGLPKLLRKLAKAAGADIDAEDEQVAVALLASKAPLAVWEAYRDALVRVARADPAFRDRLAEAELDLAKPEGFADWWVGLLLDAGVLPQLDPLIRRLCPLYSVIPVPARFAEVLDRMAGTVVSGVDDLRYVDLLLAAGFRVVPVPSRWDRRVPGLRIDGWLAENRPDLSSVAADPVFGPAVAGLVAALMPQGGPAAERLAACPAVRPHLHEWRLSRVREPLRQLATASLSTWDKPLRELEEASGIELPAEVAEIDPVRALTATLRGGLFDEFGWPALEEAMSRLSGKIGLGGAWPDLIVHDGTTALLVGRDAIVTEWPLPDLDGLAGVVYTGGELLAYRSRTPPSAVWTHEPAASFRPKLPRHFIGWCLFSLPLPDGSRTVGPGPALRPGDQTVPSTFSPSSDGTTFWRRDGDSAAPYDPVTGKATGAGLPPFLAEFEQDGAELNVLATWLAPFAGESPLGTRDGLVGLRVRRHTDGDEEWVVAESADGARVRTLPRLEPKALVRWPGSAEPRQLRDFLGTLTLLTADGTALADVPAGPVDSPWAAGTVCLPPPKFWNHMRVRDAAGSEALRAIGEDVAGPLLAAAVADLTAGDTALPRAGDALTAKLPAVTHPGLRTGLLGVLGAAARLAIRLDDLRAPAVVTPEPDELAALSALWGTGLDRYHRAVAGRDGLHMPNGLAAGRPRAHLDRVGAFLSGRTDSLGALPLERTRIAWPLLIGFAGAAARRAVSPFISPHERAALLDLLDIWADTPFAADPTGFRAGRLAAPPALGAEEQRQRDLNASDAAEAVVTPAGRHLIVQLGPGPWTVEDHPGPWCVAPGADPPPGAVMTYEWPRPWGAAERIRRFTALVRERGALAWEPAIADRLAAGTGLHPGAAALLWAALPHVRFRVHVLKDASFWPPDLGETLGLSLAELVAAARALHSVPGDDLLAILDASMPDDAAELWEPAGVDRLAEAWRARFGRDVPISPADHAEAPDPAVLRDIARPDHSPLLTTPVAESRIAFTDAGYLATFAVAADGPFLDDKLLSALLACLRWAYADRPAGHPIRAGVPRALDLVRERLDDDGLLVAAGTLWRSHLDRLATLPAAALETSIFVRERPERQIGGLDADVFVRPARASAADLDALRALRMTGSGLAAVRLLRDPRMTAIAARIRADDLPAGGYERNPALSVPDLLEAVGTNYDLPPDAATLYLQLLAFAEPTDQNVQRWNGWTPARRKKAAAVLVAAGLVEQEKRPRARRTEFIPGEWLDAGKSALPMERYKDGAADVWLIPDLFRTSWDLRGGLRRRSS